MEDKQSLNHTVWDCKYHINGFGTVTGDHFFNSDLDQDGDGIVWI